MTTYGQTKKKDDEFNFLVDSYLLDLYACNMCVQKCFCLKKGNRELL